MKKALLLSDDQNLVPELRAALGQARLETRPAGDYRKIPAGLDLLVFDADQAPRTRILSLARSMAGRQIPLVCIAGDISGPETAELLNGGVAAVLFRGQPVTAWTREIGRLRGLRRRARLIRASLENDNKTRFLLDSFTRMTADKPIQENLKRIVQSIQQTFPRFAVFLFLVSRGKISARLQSGPDSTGLAEAEWSLAEPPAWLKTMTRNRKITRITMAGEGKSFPLNSHLCPLFMKEQFAGFLALAAEPGDGSSPLSRHDRLLLVGFAEFAALTLENGKLLNDVLRTREKLIRQEKKNLLAQMVVSLNHEINNPLSIISMETQLLERDLNGSRDRLSSRLNNINNSVQRIQRLLEKITSLQVENYETIAYTSRKAMLKLHEN